MVIGTIVEGNNKNTLVIIISRSITIIIKTYYLNSSIVIFLRHKTWALPV